MKELIEVNAQMLANDSNIVIDYSDDDIFIIDKVKELVSPDATRMAMNAIIVITGGKATGELNGNPIALCENQLLLCPPNVVISDIMVSPDFEFKALFLTNAILQNFLRERIGVWNELMFIHKMHCINVIPEHSQGIMLYFDLLHMMLATMPHNDYRKECIHSLVQSAVMGLCAILSETQSQEGTIAQDATINSLQEICGRQLGSSQVIFQRFLNLLATNQNKYRTVEAYAAELCITSKYLCAVSKKVSGRTPNSWIREHVLGDIRYHLKHTDLSIKQISDLLGFPNPSFFGKYVKQNFGLTPKQFRQGQKK